MRDDEGQTSTTASTTPEAPTRLLAPLDDSPEARTALPYARALAGPGTEIILLTVIPASNEVTGVSGEVLVPADETSSVAVDQARAALEKIAQGLRNAGQAVQTEVALGDPAERILAAANALGATMIVMATHDRSGLGRLLHGSVADRVAHDATVPTMVVHAAPRDPGPVGITRLVVPLDGSPLAEEALAIATAISRRLGTSLFLVEAVDPIGLLPPAVGFAEAIPAEVYEQTEEEMEQSASDYLEGVAKRLRDEGLPVATRVLVGSPATAIIDATKLGDVVVMTSRERTGVQRWLMGSVSEQVRRGDRSPIILVPASDEAMAAS
jgi:nucleotide-binding universal stress UspA family protein